MTTGAAAPTAEGVLRQMEHRPCCRASATMTAGAGSQRGLQEQVCAPGPRHEPRTRPGRRGCGRRVATDSAAPTARQKRPIGRPTEDRAAHQVDAEGVEAQVHAQVARGCEAVEPRTSRNPGSPTNVMQHDGSEEQGQGCGRPPGVPGGSRRRPRRTTRRDGPVLPRSRRRSRRAHGPGHSRLQPARAISDPGGNRRRGVGRATGAARVPAAPEPATTSRPASRPTRSPALRRGNPSHLARGEATTLRSANRLTAAPAAGTARTAATTTGPGGGTGHPAASIAPTDAARGPNPPGRRGPTPPGDPPYLTRRDPCQS